MTESLTETVITVIGGRPHKFFVRLVELSADDFERDIVRAYRFEGTAEAKPEDKLRFSVKVTKELTLLHLRNDVNGLHDAVILFGLASIRNDQSKKEFLFTTSEFERISAMPRQDGPDLRRETLRFMHDISEVWPSEQISSVDLQDNMIGSLEDAAVWLNQLTAEGLLDRGQFKKHSRDRGKADTVAFRVAASARKEVMNELGSADDRMGFLTNKFYKLVELEVEKEGPFVFVIMPFKDSEFPQQLYLDVIVPSVEETLQCTCVRNDSDVWPGQGDDKFYSHIRKCKFLIGELTTENRNVVYELGMAHTLNKDVILLVNTTLREENKLGFDYDKFNTIFYSSERELRPRLVTSIRSLGTKQKIPCR